MSSPEETEFSRKSYPAGRLIENSADWEFKVSFTSTWSLTDLNQRMTFYGIVVVFVNSRVWRELQTMA